MEILATRRERVILDVTDNATPAFARAAAAAKLLDGSLDSLSGRAVGAGRDLDRPAQGTEKLAASARKAGPEIDRLSGRLRVLLDAAVTLGPALLPLGAGTIPLLTASLAGLGAAAGGIGVTVLALQGVGDGIEALNAYQLEPTAENLTKMKLAMEQLGPSGANFVRFLDSLEPRFREVQMLARDGLLPGVEEGITSALTRLPEVRALVSDLATGLGELAARAGESLGSDAWQSFFDYLATDARPTLEAFATSIGNVGLGIANMLVAFAPASRDFTGGLEDMTRRFAQWSAGLEQNQAFQSFLSYVRESGPLLIDFAASIGQLAAGIAKAAAPIGDVVLPALTAVANALGAIGQSPVGPAIYGAVAAFVALNRVADLSAGSFERFGVSAEKSRSAMSKFGGLAAGVVGVSMAVGALADNINRINSENLDRSLTALGLGNVTEDIDKVIDSLAELNSPLNKVDLGEIVTLGGLAGDSSLDKFANNVDQVDQALAQLVESGRASEAADLFTRITTLAGGRGISVAETAKAFDQYRLALDNAAGSGGDFSVGLSSIVGTLNAAKTATTDLTGALSALNGFFDKRAAMRNFKDSVDALTEGIKDGFTRDDVANIDAVGTSILQVAEGLQGKRRLEFLADARKQLSDFAAEAPPEVAAAVEKIISKFDKKGLTSPPPIKLTADQKELEAALVQSRRAVAGLDKARANPKFGADAGEFNRTNADVGIKLRRTGSMTANATLGAKDLASGIINSVLGALRAADGRVATTYIRTIRQEFVNPQARAEGGMIYGAGGPKDDKIPALLSNREFVQPVAAVDKYGVDFMESVRTLRFAEGGTPDKRAARDARQRANPTVVSFEAATATATALKALERQATRLEKAQSKASDAVDRNREKLDELTSAQSAMVASVAGKFDIDLGSALDSGNPWSAMSGQAGLLGQINTLTSQAAAFPALYQSLQAGGLTGQGLNQAISQLSFSQLQGVANTPGFAGQLGSALNGLYGAQQAAGVFVGNDQYGSAIADQTAVLQRSEQLAADTSRELKEMNRRVKDVERAIDRASEANKQASRENAKETGAEVKSAAGKGKDDRVYAPGRGGRGR